MLVRLIERYRRGSDWLAPGELLDVPYQEAAWLVEEGVAVPVTPDETDAKEWRAQAADRGI